MAIYYIYTRLIYLTSRIIEGYREKNDNNKGIILSKNSPQEKRTRSFKGFFLDYFRFFMIEKIRDLPNQIYCQADK